MYEPEPLLDDSEEPLTDAEWREMLANLKPPPPPPTPFQQLADRAAETARRTASGSPTQGLLALRKLRLQLEQLELRAVVQARMFDWSWGAIGDLLGISRQVVHRRYAHRVKVHLNEQSQSWYLRARKRARGIDA